VHGEQGRKPRLLGGDRLALEDTKGLVPAPSEEFRSEREEES
jgi:hypothetical protein